jgi:PAS domain S-box-containing protein
MDWLRSFFGTAAFLPHGYCNPWRPDILTLHVVSDLVIAGSYFSIPLVIGMFVRKRADLAAEHRRLAALLAAFMLGCGMTHVMAAVVLWDPVYGLEGLIKALTALVSIATAIVLWPMLPRLLEIPSVTELTHANLSLDLRVRERTAQLEAANQALEQEMVARRRSQQLLEAVAENTPAVIYVKDLPGRYLMINQRFTDIFHIGRDVAIGKTDHEMFPKDVADAFRAMDLRVALAEQPLTEEEVAPHHDGPHDYISVKSPLRDETGQVYGVFGISTDITERKEAEARLKTQLAQLALLDEITRAIGRRQDVQSIFQVIVRSVEDQLPADFACLCLYDGLDRALTVAAVGAGSQALALELAMPERARIDIDENGLARCVGGRLIYEPDTAGVDFPFPGRLAKAGLGSFVAAPLQVEGKVFGVLAVARFAKEGFASAECEFLRQLSEHAALAVHQAQLHGALQTAYDDLRQSQQAVTQQERLRALGQMASGVAHDINNALSPVGLYVESMLETETALSEGARRQLEIIRRAVEDVGHTISRMRDFHRPRELAAAPVRLNELARQVLDLTKARWSDMAIERGVVIETRTDFAPDLPEVAGVESEIREALINLIFNAVDALADGGTLTLRTAATDQSVRIEVLDDGAGMDAETRRRCLEPFFTTKGERGTGLGLAMVYGAVERHGGEIEIASAPGKGTCVTLTFPAGAPAGEATATLVSRPGLPRMRLLLVDDDPVLLKALGDSLSNDGHMVRTANAGQAGIDAFLDAVHGGHGFDAVITDLGMPYVDGRQVAAAVKAASPGTPVLLLTGWGQGLLADNDAPTHVDEVLGKPPKLHEIREALALARMDAGRG